jgi:chromosome segregation ATPase
MATSARASHSSSREERRSASPEPSQGEWFSAPEYAGSSANPDWQQIVSAIDTRIAGFEARLEQATAEFEAGALTRLQQSFGDAITQARERMKHYANACGESRLVGLEAELEHRLEPFLNRSQAAINDLEQLLETLRQEQTVWQARMAQWHQPDEARHLQDPIDLRLQRLSESLKREGRCA